MSHPISHTFSPQQLVAALGAICRALTEPAQARGEHVVARAETPLPAGPSPEDGLISCLRAIAAAQARHPQGLRELGNR